MILRLIDKQKTVLSQVFSSYKSAEADYEKSVPPSSLAQSPICAQTRSFYDLFWWKCQLEIVI